MKFIVNPKIFEEFDNPRIAVTVVEDADNTGNDEGLQKQLEEVIDDIHTNVKSETLSQQPKIGAWRDAHRQFGSKPKDYPSSVEALYKRVAKGQGLNSISPLVDAYNYISLKYMLTAGGEDLDKMKGDLELTYANAGEVPVTVLGKDEAQAPFEGEVIYKDDQGTICRRWNWREVARTMLTDETKNCILVLEALSATTDQELKEAQEEMAQLVETYCGAKTKNFIADKNNASFELN